MPLTQLEWLALPFFLLAWYAQTILELASSAAAQNREWYARGRACVPGAPPPWLYGVVWTVLYALIALAGFFYWRAAGPGASSAERDTAFAVYWINFVLNKLWTTVFFGARRPGLALVDIVLVLGTATAFLVMVARAELWWAFAFYLAYVVWLAYATYINAAWVCCVRAPPPLRRGRRAQC